MPVALSIALTSEIIPSINLANDYDIYHITFLFEAKHPRVTLDPLPPHTNPRYYYSQASIRVLYFFEARLGY